MSRALSNNECVAAQSNRDMMVPARISATLKMVKAELAFEVLVRPLRAPALFDMIDHLLH
jgi:hypothetical protein